VVEVEPGTYTVQELVVGSNFLTRINCGDGFDTGTSESVEVSEGEDVECVVRNIFNASDDGAGGVVINNTNLNDNNNNLANTNQNTSTNTNTNSQEQENRQTQNNNNNQATNVDSSPNVNISGAGPSRPASVPPTVVVAPPSTGSGGLLAGAQDHAAGPVGKLLIAVAATLSVVPFVARLSRSEK
jgi:hypothetical protein